MPGEGVGEQGSETAKSEPHGEDNRRDQKRQSHPARLVNTKVSAASERRRVTAASPMFWCDWVAKTVCCVCYTFGSVVCHCVLRFSLKVDLPASLYIVVSSHWGWIVALVGVF